MILIIGQARSGTSLAAGVLHYLGVNMGNHFPYADEWNNKGSFVDIELHQMLLEFRHYGIDLPKFQTAISLRSEPWGIKDHALLPLLPDLLPFLPVSKVIVTERDFTESLDSLTARREGTREEAQVYLTKNLVDMVKFLSIYKGDALRVPFDLSKSPSEYVKTISSFVQLPIIQQAIDFVSPELRRFPHSSSSCNCRKPSGSAMGKKIQQQVEIKSKCRREHGVRHRRGEVSSFVINLERRPDRLSAFSSSAARAGTDFSVWPAVDGSTLPCTWKDGAGAMGCSLSHRALLVECQRMGLTDITVFEDDAVFADDFQQRYSRFLSQVPEDWDALFLGGQHIATPTAVISGCVRCVQTHRTHAYRIREPYLSRMLELWSAEKRHIDHIWGENQREYRVYAPSEWLVGQGAFTSDIAKRPAVERWWHFRGWRAG